MIKASVFNPKYIYFCRPPLKSLLLKTYHKHIKIVSLVQSQRTSRVWVIGCRWKVWMPISSTEPRGFISEGIKRERSITRELKGSVYTYHPGEVTVCLHSSGGYSSSRSQSTSTETVSLNKFMFLFPSPPCATVTSLGCFT